MARQFLSGIDLLGQLATAIGANLSNGKLLGRSSAGTGAIEEISIGSGLSLSAGTLSATGGGGGLTHFVESESTASPNATVPVDALTATDAGFANIDVAIVAKGTGATLAQVPTASSAGGNKRGTYATDLQKQRSTAAQVASGTNSVICGGQSNTSSGTNSVVCGGDSNTASTTGATVAGGGTNTASGSYSTVGGGILNTASGPYSTVSGGRNHTSNGEYSFISGGRYGSTRSIIGYHAFPACAVPFSAVEGATQAGLLMIGRQTTSATATVLASDNSTPGTTNQVILPNNSAYSFSGEVIAGVTGAGNTARWTIAGAIKRGANAASTAMVGTPTVTMTHNDAGASAWTVAVTADTTNGGIKVEVTGAASTTIRWVCKINTTEMTF